MPNRYGGPSIEDLTYSPSGFEPTATWQPQWVAMDCVVPTPARVPLADETSSCPPHWWRIVDGVQTCQKCETEKRIIIAKRLKADEDYQRAVRGSGVAASRRRKAHAGVELG